MLQKEGAQKNFWTPTSCKNLYNKSYFEAARRLKKRSLLGVNKHFFRQGKSPKSLVRQILENYIHNVYF